MLYSMRGATGGESRYWKAKCYSSRNASSARLVVQREALDVPVEGVGRIGCGDQRAMRRLEHEADDVVPLSAVSASPSGAIRTMPRFPRAMPPRTSCPRDQMRFLADAPRPRKNTSLLRPRAKFCARDRSSTWWAGHDKLTTGLKRQVIRGHRRLERREIRKSRGRRRF